MAAAATDSMRGTPDALSARAQEPRNDEPRVAPADSTKTPSPRRPADLPRSASYTNVSGAKEKEYRNPQLVTIKGSFSENDLIAHEEEGSDDISPPESSGSTTPEDGEAEQESQQSARKQQRDSKISSSTGQKGQDASTDAAKPAAPSAGHATETPTTPQKQKRERQSVSNFSRKINRDSVAAANAEQPATYSPTKPNKPYTSTSENAGEEAPARPGPGATSRRKSFMKKVERPKQAKVKDSAIEEVNADGVATRRPQMQRRPTLSGRAAKRVSGLFESSSSGEKEQPKTTAPDAPKMPTLPKSYSTDRLPSPPTNGAPRKHLAPSPAMLASERAGHGSSGLGKKKDELHNQFRTLDGEFTKFANKTSAFKATVVRTSLLPFLREFATHPSNTSLKPEDLDRRATILNKWWNGLIEMLHGKHNQSISGTDRPVIMDGISGIMIRPEWRLPPSPFCPLNDRMKGVANRSTTSFSSSGSEFVAESVNHNVRNIFIHNLTAQMAFVVDKMSMRSAPASLVTFCGKACAFAFMFVPGMADMLVRMWQLHTNTLRRVLHEYGVGKFENLAEVSDHIAPVFPPALQSLSFVSLMKYVRKLRIHQTPPVGLAHIEWSGRWLERWSGQESDLFYVFAKHVHILIADFLPANATDQERVCAPGLLLVHSQLLSNLDATIHRDANQANQEANTGATETTFDDVLAGPDAYAPTVPTPPNNVVRHMAENRLIMLIRDFLSDRASEYPVARQMFAEATNKVLHAAARGTSMYNHAACYTLLDFLEEALALLIRFENVLPDGATLIDRDFWNDVCKKMIESHNTMTEVRLYTFLYTVWNTIVSDSGRKADVCLGLLLDKDVFESRFNHWCPMVRAYYMRLLCWRVGRFDGEPMEGEEIILSTMLGRLQETWAHYLFLYNQAEQHNTLAPATIPCPPAPGRRLLIIRTDAKVGNGGSFFSLDQIVSSSSPDSDKSSPSEPDAHADSTPSTPDSSDTDPTEHRGRSISGFFRSLLGSRPRSKSQSQSPTPAASKDRPGPPKRANTSETSASKPTTSDKPFDVPARPRLQPSDPPLLPAHINRHRNSFFKFSLEPVHHPNNTNASTSNPAAAAPPAGANTSPRVLPPRLPMPAQLYLQAQASRPPTASVNVAPVAPAAGEPHARARYAGRALAEWVGVVAECESFFARRRGEGVPGNRWVETPTLGIENFRRPG